MSINDKLNHYHFYDTIYIVLNNIMTGIIISFIPQITGIVP